MSSVAPVDFGTVVKAYNQSPIYGKFDPSYANFDANTRLELAEVKWTKATLQPDDGFHHLKQVRVDTSRKVTTTVSVGNEVPGSRIKIVSGFLKGLSSSTATTEIDSPPQLPKHKIKLDLTKQDQRVIVGATPLGGQVEKSIQGTGVVKVKSTNTVYQGSFEATAKLSGEITFKEQQGTVQMGVHTLVKITKGHLPSPFFSDGEKLCWLVSGSIDYHLESLNLTS